MGQALGDRAWVCDNRVRLSGSRQDRNKTYISGVSSPPFLFSPFPPFIVSFPSFFPFALSPGHNAAPQIQLEGFWEHCKLPSRVRGFALVENALCVYWKPGECVVPVFVAMNLKTEANAYLRLNSILHSGCNLC